MNNKTPIVIILFIFLQLSIFSQIENNSPTGSLSIISSQIEYVDTVIVGSKRGITKVYPPKYYPIKKLLYHCKLTIKLNGEDLTLSQPFIVKCFLPDNSLTEIVLNNDGYILTTDEFYDFNFDIYSDNRLFGWTTLELHQFQEKDDNSSNKIRYDKTTLFIQ